MNEYLAEVIVTIIELERADDSDTYYPTSRIFKFDVESRHVEDFIEDLLDCRGVIHGDRMKADMEWIP